MSLVDLDPRKIRPRDHLANDIRLKAVPGRTSWDGGQPDVPQPVIVAEHEASSQCREDQEKAGKPHHTERRQFIPRSRGTWSAVRVALLEVQSCLDDHGPHGKLRAQMLQLVERRQVEIMGPSERDSSPSPTVVPPAGHPLKRSRIEQSSTIASVARCGSGPPCTVASRRRDPPTTSCTPVTQRSTRSPMIQFASPSCRPDAAGSEGQDHDVPAPRLPSDHVVVSTQRTLSPLVDRRSMRHCPDRFRA